MPSSIPPPQHSHLEFTPDSMEGEFLSVEEVDTNVEARKKCSRSMDRLLFLVRSHIFIRKLFLREVNRNCLKKQGSSVLEVLDMGFLTSVCMPSLNLWRDLIISALFQLYSYYKWVLHTPYGVSSQLPWPSSSLGLPLAAMFLACDAPIPPLDQDPSWLDQ